MTRPDRPRRHRAPAPAPELDGDGPDSDITGAYQRARGGAATAGAALDAKTKKTAVVVALVLALFTLVNTSANIYFYDSFSDSAVARANSDRLNGAAQEQARRALDDAEPAQRRLVALGLFPVTISPPTQSPASEVIANSASVQVLADMPRAAIVGEDYVALGAAVERFYQRQPTITQSGPTPLKVQQLAQQYLQVAARLDDQGALRGPR